MFGNVEETFTHKMKKLEARIEKGISRRTAKLTGSGHEV